MSRICGTSVADSRYSSWRFAAAFPALTGEHGVSLVTLEIGNDLSTPMPAFGLAGLQPGDRWAVCAGRWLQSFEAGVEGPVVIHATNEAALDYVPMAAREACSVDVPDDVGWLSEEP